MISKVFQVVVIIFCCFWLTKEILLPGYVYFIYIDEYKELVTECARAMDTHWDVESSELKSEELTNSTKTGLMICHDYDKTRKMLLSFGINEYILSYAGLASLEVGPQTIDEIIKPHIFTSR
jgi:His-Xaa-Ser system protein (TIGR03982 family)